MYWTDWGKWPKIERSWMDGSHRSAIVTEDVVWPNGLAVDGERIYWIDANLDIIETARVDGSDRRPLINSELPHPFGLTLLGDYLYWTDWKESTVQRARKDTGEERTILAAHIKELMGVFASKTRPDAPDSPCSADNGGCSHLCLATPEGRRCQCPDADGYELGADGETCIVPEAFILYTRKSVVGRLSMNPGMENDYTLPLPRVSDASALDFDRTDGRIYWSDIEEKTISRAHLNGSSAEVVVGHGLDFPDGLAVDWNAGNLYWTDMGLDRIEVCRTDGSSRRVLVWQELSKPCSIVLNPEDGLMYWSTWGDVPLIEKAALDGSDRRVFRSDVGRANGLTIDFSTSRIYWTDLGLSGGDAGEATSISYAYLQPSLQATKVVVSSSRQPYGLTLFKNNVYWADWNLTSVRRADKDTGSGEVVIQANLSGVMDLTVYQESLQRGSNDCKFDNGGCSDLCLFARGEVVCACASHFRASPDGLGCLPPTDFLLFSQKNKVSRIFQGDGEVPDLVLPIQVRSGVGELKLRVINGL